MKLTELILDELESEGRAAQQILDVLVVLAAGIDTRFDVAGWRVLVVRTTILIVPLGGVAPLVATGVHGPQ